LEGAGKTADKSVDQNFLISWKFNFDFLINFKKRRQQNFRLDLLFKNNFKKAKALNEFVSTYIQFEIHLIKLERIN